MFSMQYPIAANNLTCIPDVSLLRNLMLDIEDRVMKCVKTVLRDDIDQLLWAHNHTKLLFSNLQQSEVLVVEQLKLHDCSKLSAFWSGVCNGLLLSSYAGVTIFSIENRSDNGDSLQIDKRIKEKVR